MIGEQILLEANVREVDQGGVDEGEEVIEVRFDLQGNGEENLRRIVGRSVGAVR